MKKILFALTITLSSLFSQVQAMRALGFVKEHFVKISLSVEPVKVSNFLTLATLASVEQTNKHFYFYDKTLFLDKNLYNLLVKKGYLITESHSFPSKNAYFYKRIGHTEGEVSESGDKIELTLYLNTPNLDFN